MSRLPRRSSGPALASLAWALAAWRVGGQVPPTAPPQPVAVYVGTYTSHGSRGIYRFESDPGAGTWTQPVLAAESENPSFLAPPPRGDVLYAVNEVARFGGAATGAVSAFAIDAAGGGLTLLGQQPSGGADPCHLVVDRSGRKLLVANYTGGSVALLPIGVDGRLEPAADLRTHAGSGPDASRQAGPHAHAVTFDPAERFALAADLGADRLFVYRSGARLEPNAPGEVALEPGSGPRHVAWHPSGGWLYVLGELRSTVTALRYDAARGTLEPFQTISTLPAGFAGRNTTAEVEVSPDGRFLYASNRGDDSLALFRIDPATGAVAPAGRFPTGGRTPRHFAIDPSGRWLLAANQESDSITFFRRDPADGRLTTVGPPLAVSMPVCLLFARPRGRAAGI